MDVTPEHFDKMFDTNARGTFFTVQKALPLMNDGGSIVLIGSGVWEKSIPNYVTYSATKAACARMCGPGPVNSRIARFGRT